MVLNDFFTEINKQRVNYAHFKSSIRIPESMIGEQDLDILVEETDFHYFCDTLRSFGGIEVRSDASRSYPNVFDWLLVCRESGILFHFHLHTRIITGARFVKDFCLPFHECILNSREFDEKFNIYRVDYNYEFTLFVIRECLKVTFFQVVFKLLTRNSDIGYKNELDWLRQKCTSNQIESSCKAMGISPSVVSIVLKAYAGEDKISLREVVEIKRSFKCSQRVGGFTSHVLQLYHFVRIFLFNRVLKKGFILKKKAIGVPPIFALVGCDGAGKTTMERLLVKKLGRHLAIKNIYLGTGDGSHSFLFILLKKIFARKPKDKSTQISTDEDSSNNLRISNNVSLLRSISALYVAYTRYRLMKKAHSLRSKGYYIFFTRYPQLTHPGLNDGLKLSNARGRLKRVFESIEYSIVSSTLRKYHADDLYVLSLPLETVVKRRQDTMDIKRISQKHAAIMTTDWSVSGGIEYIDATKSQELVYSSLVERIWDSYKRG